MTSVETWRHTGITLGEWGFRNIGTWVPPPFRESDMIGMDVIWPWIFKKSSPETVVWIKV